MRHWILLIIFILVFWAFFIEPNALVVNQQTINIPELKGIKIVFAGDFHVKPDQKNRLAYIVKKINQQHPDLVLSTGDFVSGHDPKQSMPIEEIAGELSKVKSKYGFYSVLGNHDWWQGGEKIGKTLEKNGIKVLANSNAKININGKSLYIAGVEDMGTRTIDLTKALKNTTHPTILLTHTPDVFPFITNKSNSKVSDKVDLTLAGHTHGGQVYLPYFGALIISSDYGNEYAKGQIQENGKKLFVTEGIGTSILPVRFNCPPEIVVFNFK